MLFLLSPMAPQRGSQLMSSPRKGFLVPPPAHSESPLSTFCTPTAPLTTRFPLIVYSPLRSTCTQFWVTLICTTRWRTLSGPSLKENTPTQWRSSTRPLMHPIIFSTLLEFTLASPLTPSLEPPSWILPW